jgi:AraC family transcriptional regulator, regulatory protein of adaptative response / DNA-3-methyladenine glycosylase II
VIPDDDTCYEALLARDGRFDGAFFVGVVTTGIYCRPVCPARTPLRPNVRFYASAAAASAAGLRACRRCRPDALPGSREWDHRSDLVARALRLIGSGQVDEGGVGTVAEALHVSERHLRRVMVEELGVGPLELARTRRAQTARMLIEQTRMTLTDVSFAAGFASIRQFNDVMRKEFGTTPRELRRPAPEDGRTAGDSRVALRLRYRRPYDMSSALAWLSRHAVPAVDVVSGSTVTTTLANGDRVECRFAGDGVRVELRAPDLTALPGDVAAIRSWLDLDAVPLAVDDALRRNRILAAMVAARPGMRVIGSPSPFRAVTLAVLGQQVSVAAARTLAGRLCSFVSPGRFPGADELAAATPPELAAAVGMPQSRAQTVHRIAEAVAGGEIPLGGEADRDDVIRQFGRIRGVGPWTSADIRMRALRDPDVWPRDDLVLRRTFATEPSDCAPWRSYAAHHVWTAAKHEEPARPGREQEEAS